jgi:hypothetical protein
MNINVVVMLASNEYAADLPGNSTELAQKIFDAFEADPTKDTCHVSVQDFGTAGWVPPPLEPDIPLEPSPVTVNSSFATNNATPPLDKQTRTNTSSPATTTAVYVDDESTEGDDISAKLLALVVGDKIEIRMASDTTRYAIFALTAAPIDQSGFVELPVAHDESGTNALTTGACTLKFSDRS